MKLGSDRSTNLAGYFLLLFLFGSTGCHSYMLDDAQFELRDSMTSMNYDESRELLNELESKNIYRKKDQVLWNLENGMIYHFTGDYDSSTVFFSEAENEIDEAYTKSVSRGVVSLFSNDNKLAYDGEPYEDIYLNAFKALNFIHQGDWDGALVETRRMSYKMENLDIRIKGLADAFARQDTNNLADWTPGKLNVQNSAMSHYLATILYAKSGDVDDSRIEFMKLQTALNEQAEAFGYPSIDTRSLQYLQNPNAYNLLITGFTGQAPIKVQEDVRFFDETTLNRYVKLSFPRIELYPTEVYRVHVLINDKEPLSLKLIEEMDRVAKSVYEAKKPVIYARTLARALVKATGTGLIKKATEDESRALRTAVSVLSFLYKETSEKADLRGWQTKPGQAWMEVVKLQPGVHTIRLEYLNDYDQIMYFEEFEVVIDDRTELELIESMYPR